MAVIPTPEEKSKYHFIVQPKPVDVKMTPDTITVAAAVGKQAVDKASQGDIPTAGGLLVAAGALVVGTGALPAVAAAGFAYWLLGGFKSAPAASVPTAAPVNNNTQTVVNATASTNTNASPPGFIGKQNVNTMTQTPPITTFQTQKEMQQFANHNTSKDHRLNHGGHNCAHCAIEDKAALAREEERLARERKALITPPVTTTTTVKTEVVPVVQEAPKAQSAPATFTEKRIAAHEEMKVAKAPEIKAGKDAVAAALQNGPSTPTPKTPDPTRQSNQNARSVAGDRPKTETHTGKSRKPQNKGAVPPLKMPNNNGNNGNGNNQKPPEKKPEEPSKKHHESVEPPHYEKSPRTERIEFKKDAQIRDNYDQMPDGTLRVKANARNPLKTKDGKIIHAIKIDVVDKNKKPIDGFDINGKPIAAIDPHSKTPFPPLPSAPPLNDPSGKSTPQDDGSSKTPGYVPFYQMGEYEKQQQRIREEEAMKQRNQALWNWGMNSNQNSMYTMEQEYANRFAKGGYYEQKAKEEEKRRQEAWGSRSWKSGE